MHIPCEIYYEKYLGDWCDNKCEKCFGEKEVYECTEDFEVCGDTILDSVKIKKGEWFWVAGKNRSHIRLCNGTDHELWLTHELFEKYFTDKFVVEL